MLCWRCAASVPDGIRFCATCGANALEPPSEGPPGPAVDPLAATALANPEHLRALHDVAVAQAASTSQIPPPGRGMTTPLSAVPSDRRPPVPRPSALGSTVPLVGKEAPSRPAPRPSPSAAPTAAPSLQVGRPVIVVWSDGKKYPGIVRQLSEAQCCVGFSDGQQHWVGRQYVTLASDR